MMNSSSRPIFIANGMTSYLDLIIYEVNEQIKYNFPSAGEKSEDDNALNQFRESYKRGIEKDLPVVEAQLVRDHLIGLQNACSGDRRRDACESAIIAGTRDVYVALMNNIGLHLYSTASKVTR